MAGNNLTKNLRDAPVFEYNQHLGGELIYGTKEQLQRIGIAAGMAFPSELKGPKRRLRVTDPRGFEARVENAEYRGDGLFSVSISFPGRERPEPVSNFAFGVKKREYQWGDIFTGTAESLSATGLVRRDQFPGQPGMRKVAVTILADGSFHKGAPTANCREARESGAIRISKKSKAVYEVSIHVTREEKELRRDKHSRADREWEAKMRSLPRPEPLCRINQEREEPHALDPREFASFTLDMLNIQLNKPDLAPFSKESKANIQRLIGELRTAYAAATFVKIPKHTVNGNVVYLSK